jgi:cob(I)alamin adenosyltransferase
MANRLSKITTRTGDDGSTGLGDGTRVPKAALRIHAMGEVDEVNACLGVLLCESLPASIQALLTRIQNQLFDLGAELCIPGHRAVTEPQIVMLDNAIAEFNGTLPPLKEFILPGGSRAAALTHIARTVARRAERAMVTLAADEDVSASALQYINRLSDLLFILARHANIHAGVKDVCWTRETAT